MTSTNELIAALAADLKPVRSGAVTRRLAAGIGAGALVAAAAMLAVLGVRHDLVAALGTSAYWIKFGYTALLALAGMAAVARLGRPDGIARGPALAGLAVVALVAALAALQLAGATPEAVRPLLMGASAKSCPWIVMLVALPVLAGTLWAMRGLAPTRLALAGAAAGLMAGGLGAWIYAFYCDETAVPFLAIWYSAGIAGVGLIGALAGPWALRWR